VNKDSPFLVNQQSRRLIKDGITTLRSGKSLLFVSVLGDKTTESQIEPTVKKIVQKEKKKSKMKISKRRPLDLDFISSEFFKVNSPIG
jgi:hypothetical protein